MASVGSQSIASATKPKNNKQKKKKKTTASSETDRSPSVSLPSRLESEAELNGENKADPEDPQPPTGSPSPENPTPQDENPEHDEESSAEPSTPAAHGTSNGTSDSSELSRRFEVLAREREELRIEVERLRKSLEGLTEQHSSEVKTLADSLQAAQQEKESSEANYRSLVGKVNTIKASLGERLKADAAELEVLRSRNEQLEESNGSLQESHDQLAERIADLDAREAARGKELAEVRSRAAISQQNWTREREELQARDGGLREQLQAASQSIQDWELVALEERSARQSLTERLSELEERLESARSANEGLQSVRDGQADTLQGLQRALSETQKAREKELQDLAQTSHAQLEALKEQREAAAAGLESARKEITHSKTELERLMPFEREIKEKNLQIGKLRHEAVVLNDHLTKALRFLKKGRPEENVDKHIVTNHFLQFLALDRADPKKFQILQLIGALLSWTEEEKEQAGLSRAGSSNPDNNPPSATAGRSTSSFLLPFSRRPSAQNLTPTSATSLHHLDSPTGGASRESLAELWSSFLEQESAAGQGGQPGPGPGSDGSRPGSSRDGR